MAANDGPDAIIVPMAANSAGTHRLGAGKKRQARLDIKLVLSNTRTPTSRRLEGPIQFLC